MIIDNNYIFRARVIEHDYSIYDTIKDYPYCSAIVRDGTPDDYRVTVNYYYKNANGNWVSGSDVYYRADQYLTVTILGSVEGEE